MDKSKEQSAKKTFWVSLVICLAFLAAGIAAPGKFGEYTNKVFSFMTNNLGWSFILGASAFIIVIIFVMVSPYGKIKLGKDDDEPEDVYKRQYQYCNGYTILCRFHGIS